MNMLRLIANLIKPKPRYGWNKETLQQAELEAYVYPPELGEGVHYEMLWWDGPCGDELQLLHSSGVKWPKQLFEKHKHYVEKTSNALVYPHPYIRGHLLSNGPCMQCTSYIETIKHGEIVSEISTSGEICL